MQTFQFVGGLDIQSRITAPEDVPGTSNGYQEAALEHAYWQMGLSNEYHDYLDDVVNNETALKYSAVWRCVQWISQTIASLCFNVFERDGKTRKQIDIAEDDVAWLLEMQANAEMSAFDWRQVNLKDALTLGNGYSEIERDGFNRIQNLWSLDPSRVEPDRTMGGTLIYEVKNGSGMKNTILRPDQVFHLKNMSPDGIVGYSVIEMARKNIKGAIHEEQFGDKFFSRGPTPSGILTTPQKLAPKAEEEARKSFDRLYAGQKNAGRVIRLTGAATFTPLSLPNNDAQFIESRTFSLETICRWFGVPPHKIADLSKSTNNNIEQQSIEAVQDCLWPWCRRLETEANIKLFGRVNRGKRFTKLNLQEILRGDSVALATSLNQQITGGIRSPNEARDVLDLDPRPEGDKLMIQGAMVALEEAQKPKPEAQPNPAPPNGQQDTGNPQPPDGAGAKPATEKTKQATARLLQSLYADCLVTEKEKIKRAMRPDSKYKGSIRSFIADFYPSNANWLAERLLPIFTVATEALGWNIDPEELVSSAVERHNQASMNILQSFNGKASFDGWDSRAEQQSMADLTHD